MLADPPLTPADRVLLARFALNATPETKIVDLFPHLRRVVDDPVGGRHGTSARLASILGNWHGPTWGPYLEETLMAVRLRRNLGYRTLGEFVAMAITAAEPEGGPRSAMAPHPTRSSVDAPPPATDLGPVREGRAIIAQLARYAAPPPAGVLRAAATSILAAARDVPFHGLVPTLATVEDRWIDVDPMLSGRLGNLLSRWHGFRWEPYLLETPGSMWLQRTAGHTRLGAFLWLMSRRSASPSTTSARTAGRSVSTATRLPSGHDDFDDAVHRLSVLIENASEREWVLMRRRLLGPGRGGSLAELGTDLSWSSVRVRQLWANVTYRIRGEVVIGGSLKRVVDHTRAALGMAWPLGALDQVPGFDGMVLSDPDDLVTGLLLWVAGPYERVDDWLVLRPAGRRIQEARRVLRRDTVGRPLPLDEAHARLVRLGLRESVADDWIRDFTNIHIDRGMVSGSRDALHAYFVWRAGRSRRRRAPGGAWLPLSRGEELARRPPPEPGPPRVAEPIGWAGGVIDAIGS